MATQEEKVRITIDGRDNASAVFKQLGRNLAGFLSGVAGARSGGFGLASSLATAATSGGALAATLGGALVGGITLATGAMAKGAATAENYETRLGVLLRSVDAGKAAFKELSAFADKTPFTDAEVMKGAEQLLSFGFKYKDLIPILTDIGDFAGVDEEKINRVAIAFGQMNAKGRVEGDELLQLMEAGVPVAEILAEKLHLTGQQLQHIGDLGLPAQKVIAAIREGMHERFGGGMEMFAKTSTGLFSNLQAAAMRFIQTMGRGLEPITKGSMAFLTELLSEAVKDAQALTSSDTWSGFIEALQEVGHAAAPLAKDLLPLAFTALVASLKLAAPILRIIAFALDGIRVAFESLLKLLKPVIDFFHALWQELKSIDWQGAWQAVKEWALSIWNYITEKAQPVLQWLKDWAEWAFDKLKSGFSWTVDVALPWLNNAVGPALHWLKEEFWEKFLKPLVGAISTWTFTIVLPWLGQAVEGALHLVKDVAALVDKAWTFTINVPGLDALREAWNLVQRLAGGGGSSGGGNGSSGSGGGGSSFSGGGSSSSGGSGGGGGSNGGSTGGGGGAGSAGGGGSSGGGGGFGFGGGGGGSVGGGGGSASVGGSVAVPANVQSAVSDAITALNTGAGVAQASGLSGLQSTVDYYRSLLQQAISNGDWSGVAQIANQAILAMAQGITNAGASSGGAGASPGTAGGTPPVTDWLRDHGNDVPNAPIGVSGGQYAVDLGNGMAQNVDASGNPVGDPYWIDGGPPAAPAPDPQPEPAPPPDDTQYAVDLGNGMAQNVDSQGNPVGDPYSLGGDTPPEQQPDGGDTGGNTGGDSGNGDGNQEPSAQPDYSGPAYDGSTNLYDPNPEPNQFTDNPDAYGFADGGVVMPTAGGILGRIAEAGRPEAVIPLDRLPGLVGDMVGGGGGHTFNFNHYGDLRSADDARAALREFSRRVVGSVGIQRRITIGGTGR